MPMFFARAFLAFFRLAGWFFAGIFRAPFARLFVAWGLDAAQRAAEIFNFPFVIKLLLFRQFNQFKDVLHLFKRFFERFDNAAHIVHGPGQGGRGVLWLRALAFFGRLRRPVNGSWLRLSPFDGRCFDGFAFRRMFLRWRSAWLNGGRRCRRACRSRWMGRTHSASTPATAAASAAG